MKLTTLCLATSAVLFGITATASAAPFYDSALSSPGVYFGAGNANSNFTVDTNGSVETGLSAIQRFLGPIASNNGVYNVSTGPTSVAGKAGADWGFIFSVNLNANGQGALRLPDITARLTLTDVGLGTTGSFNLLAIPDNTLYGASGTCYPSSNCKAANFYAFQNSEALSFASVAGALGDPLFDLNADDTYLFSLDVFNGENLLSNDRITVVAGRGAIPVPEPVTFSIFGAGLIGAFAARRRRKAA